MSQFTVQPVTPTLVRALVVILLLAFFLYHVSKLFFFVFIYPFYVSPLRKLPGPKDNNFIFGQCKKFLKAAWVPYLYQEWSRRWPESPFIRFLGLFNSEYLIINSVQAYQEVLQTKNSSFYKPALTRKAATVVIGDGLPFAEGDLHRRRKGVLLKAFSVPSVKNFVPTIIAKADSLARCLESARQRSNVVEVESLLWKASLDLIGIKALGVDLNHVESDDSQLHTLVGETMKQSLSGHIIHYLSSYLPLRRLLPIEMNNNFLSSCAQIRELIWAHVRDCRCQINSGTKTGTPNAIRLMMEQEPLWNDEEIVEYILNLLILGHDTTSCSLVWAVSILSRDPKHQDRIRKEIEGLGLDPEGLGYEQIERLRFLDNFIREVLRTHCPVAYVPREAIEDVEIAGVHIPKGTVIHPCPGVINLHPQVWGPTASEFDPDRWDNLQGAAANAYAFETFHNGPRVCIGKQLSIVEMKVMLIKMVTKFRIEAVDEHAQIELASPSFTLRPKEKLCVRLVDIM
uniref:Cytochrome P450 n=1 Tax=Bionectria ochroleuca TaxID=29856 RepID=A0A8H7K2H3_BIOOC